MFVDHVSFSLHFLRPARALLASDMLSSNCIDLPQCLFDPECVYDHLHESRCDILDPRAAGVAWERASLEIFWRVRRGASVGLAVVKDQVLDRLLFSIRRRANHRRIERVGPLRYAPLC
jgi:hypothetical protein